LAASRPSRPFEIVLALPVRGHRACLLMGLFANYLMRAWLSGEAGPAPKG
jgi:hypothetical protein